MLLLSYYELGAMRLTNRLTNSPEVVVIFNHSLGDLYRPQSNNKLQLSRGGGGVERLEKNAAGYFGL